MHCAFTVLYAVYSAITYQPNIYSIYINKQPNEFGLFGPYANMENQLNTLAMKPPKNANAAECTNCYKHTRVVANTEGEAEGEGERESDRERKRG